MTCPDVGYENKSDAGTRWNGASYDELDGRAANKEEAGEGKLTKP